MARESKNSFGTFLGIFGAILIGIGIFWLIAQNWHQIPAVAKIVILLVAVCASFIIGNYLENNDSIKTGKVLYLLGSILYTASIFLIAQIFSTEASMQGMAWLFLLAFVGVIIAAYIFISPMSLVLGLAEFLMWLNLQYSALNTFDKATPFSIFIITLLAIGVLLYGLFLIHKSMQHAFARVYQWWMLVYFLLFSYLLSFQLVAPLLWMPKTTLFAPAAYFLLAIIVIAITIFSWGLTYARQTGKVDSKELKWFTIAIVSLFALVIISAALPKGTEGMFGLFGGRGQMSAMLWVFWILANIIFLAVILGVVGYGTWQKQPRIINLGIAFFSLDVITRYIGFIIDLRGYLGLSLIFVTGGILLIAGGWFIQKWRVKLIKETGVK